MQDGGSQLDVLSYAKPILIILHKFYYDFNATFDPQQLQNLKHTLT